MTSKYVAQFMLGDILTRLGVAKCLDGPVPLSAKRILDPVLTWGWQHTPKLAQQWLEPWRHGARELVQLPVRDSLVPIDAAASQCFIINNNHTHGGIRVNLAGREPAGKVRPGPDYEAFLNELARDLLDIVNVETGGRIVKNVIRTRDLYSEEGTEHFPDLLVEWANVEPVRAVHSKKIGRLDKEYVYCRTGEHTPGGLFVATGPGIGAGHLPKPVSILDFAPTFCEALGVRHDGFDGKAIPELAAPL